MSNLALFWLSGRVSLSNRDGKRPPVQAGFLTDLLADGDRNLSRPRKAADHGGTRGRGRQSVVHWIRLCQCLRLCRNLRRAGYYGSDALMDNRGRHPGVRQPKQERNGCERRDECRNPPFALALEQPPCASYRGPVPNLGPSQGWSGRLAGPAGGRPRKVRAGGNRWSYRGGLRCGLSGNFSARLVDRGARDAGQKLEQIPDFGSVLLCLLVNCCSSHGCGEQTKQLRRGQRATFPEDDGTVHGIQLFAKDLIFAEALRQSREVLRRAERQTGRLEKLAQLLDIPRVMAGNLLRVGLNVYHAGRCTQAPRS